MQLNTLKEDNLRLGSVHWVGLNKRFKRKLPLQGLYQPLTKYVKKFSTDLQSKLQPVLLVFLC